MTRIPSVHALLIQAVSLAAMCLLESLLRSWAGMEIPMPVFVLGQGTIAAVVSYLRKLSWWWWPIQFLFPCALLGAQALHLPPAIFLAAFVILLCLYWSTFRTQVPFFPSNPTVWCAVEHLLPANRPTRFIDIGSGFGGLVLHLASARPDGSYAGIELAPLPWVVSSLRTWIRRGKCTFMRGDYEQLDFSVYDVVFAYLSPVAMEALWRKAQAEMRCEALLLSYEFHIPGIKPDIIIVPDPNGPALYGWHMQRAVEST